MPDTKRMFPKTLLVTHHVERDDSEYLMTHTDVEDIGEECHDDPVAIYELKSITRLKVEKRLLDQ